MSMELRLWSILSAANSSDDLVAAVVRKAIDDGVVLVVGDPKSLERLELEARAWSTERFGAIDCGDPVDWRTVYPETGE